MPNSDLFCLQQQGWYKLLPEQNSVLGSQIDLSLLLSYWEPCLAISVINCRIRAFSVCLFFNLPSTGKNCLKKKNQKTSLSKATKQSPHKFMVKAKPSFVRWPWFLSLSVKKIWLHCQYWRLLIWDHLGFIYTGDLYTFSHWAGSSRSNNSGCSE